MSHTPKPLDSRLPKDKVLLILHCLVEGNSIRSTARIADVEKRTVINLMLSAGENCERLLSARIRNILVKDVQADEIWTFCKKKEGIRFPHEANTPDIGDAFSFIDIEYIMKLF